MKKQLILPILILAGSLGASAAACGTIASPGSCVVTVGGQVAFTFSNFAFINNSAIGAAPVAAGDIGIDVAAGSGLQARITFGKVITTANPFASFVANSGQTNNFLFSYDVSVAPVVPGTALLIDPTDLLIVNASSAGTGSGQVQFVRPSAPVCVATLSTLSNSCTLPPATTTSIIGTGNIVTLNGGTGNAAMGDFRNIFNASFAPDAGEVPEPSTFALTLGAAALLYFKRRR